MQKKVSDIKGIRFSGFLSISNYGIILLCLIFLLMKHTNNYVSMLTYIIQIAVCLESIVFLKMQKINKDPFALVFTAAVTFFFSFRTATLGYTGYSVALARMGTGPSGINLALVYIFFANFLLYAVTMVYSVPVEPRYGSINTLTSSIKQALPSIMLLAAVVINFSGFLSEVLPGRFSVWTRIFLLNPQGYLFLLLVSAVFLWGNLKKKVKILYIAAVLIFIAAEFLSSSRAAVFQLLMQILPILVVAFGDFFIKRKVVFYIAAGVVLSVVFYTGATSVRQNGLDRTRITAENVKIFISAIQRIDRRVINIICDRLGFLDYSADIITNHAAYRKVINPVYMFKSMVDNGLTPGFDIFNAPSMATSIRAIYEKHEHAATHKDVADYYHSDMLTVYGLYYALFGPVVSLLALSLFYLLYRMIYNKAILYGGFRQLVLSIAVLSVFLNYWFDSFGLDHVLLELLGAAFLIGILMVTYDKQMEISTVEN